MKIPIMILLIDRFGKMLLAVLHCIFKSLQRLFLFRIGTNGTAFFILKKLAHSALNYLSVYLSKQMQPIVVLRYLFN